MFAAACPAGDPGRAYPLTATLWCSPLPTVWKETSCWSKAFAKVSRLHSDRLMSDSAAPRMIKVMFVPQWLTSGEGLFARIFNLSHLNNPHPLPTHIRHIDELPS